MSTEGVRAEPVSMLSRSGTLHLIGRASGTGRFQTECGTGWAFTRGQDTIRQRRACKLCFPPVPDFSSSTLTDLQKLTDERGQARDIAVRLEQENARMVDALQLISRHGCESFVTPYNCRTMGQVRGAKYGGDAWCEACIALDALTAAPVDGAE